MKQMHTQIGGHRLFNMCSRKKSDGRKDIVELRVPEVKIECEKIGFPEQLLKDRLVTLLRKQTNIRSAYLAQVRLGAHAGVALCLGTQTGADKIRVEHILTYLARYLAAVSTSILFS